MASILNTQKPVSKFMSEKDIMNELKALRKEVRAIREHLEDTTLTPEEEILLEECKREAAEGKTVPHEQVVRELQDRV